MSYKLRVMLFALVIFAFASKSLVHNTWDLLHLRLPKYYVNASLLSGTLLLYDRPMFFESRQIEIREKGKEESQLLEYDLSVSGFNSYLHRRLFRFATNEFNCGIDSKAAFQYLFCRPELEILKNRNIEEVIVHFTPHWNSGQARSFQNRCDAHE